MTAAACRQHWCSRRNVSPGAGQQSTTQSFSCFTCSSWRSETGLYAARENEIPSFVTARSCVFRSRPALHASSWRPCRMQTGDFSTWAHTARGSHYPCTKFKERKKKEEIEDTTDNPDGKWRCASAKYYANVEQTQGRRSFQCQLFPPNSPSRREDTYTRILNSWQNFKVKDIDLAVN